METIGDKIRYYREKRGYSRSDFCGIEDELTIRQLSRIENGDSNPTVATIQYIAKRLNLPSYRLMPDFYALPADYKELKYLLLRHPVYGNPSLLKQQDEYMTSIYDEFYDSLPVEEQFVIVCLKALFEMHRTGEIHQAHSVIEKHIDDFSHKSYFTINDLPFFRVVSGYLSGLHQKGERISPKLLLIFEASFVKLLKQADLFPIYTLFIYENSIFSSLIHYGIENNYSLYPESIDLLKAIIQKTQNYQKKPLIYMLEWKVNLFLDSNLSQAIEKYYRANELAKLLGDNDLTRAIDTEWHQDLDKFLKKFF